MNTESEMKQLILQPLGTEETHQLSAVQVIAGVDEIIQNKWLVIEHSFYSIRIYFFKS